MKKKLTKKQKTIIVVVSVSLVILLVVGLSLYFYFRSSKSSTDDVSITKPTITSVTNFHIVRFSSDSITVQWNPPTSTSIKVLEYILSFAANTSILYQPAYQTTENNYTFVNLNPNTLYKLQVQCVLTNGTYQTPIQINQLTLTSPGAIISPVVTNKSPNSLFVTFQPSKNAVAYEFSTAIHDTSDWVSNLIYTPSSIASTYTAEIQNLQSSTAYDIEIKSIDQNYQEGIPTVITNITTTVGGDPGTTDKSPTMIVNASYQNIVIDPTTKTVSVTLVWYEEVSKNADHYSISYYDASIGTDVQTSQIVLAKPENHISNVALTTNVSGLIQGHTYVYAFYALDGTYSSPGVTLRITFPTVPNDVVSIWSTENDETSLTLNWNVKETDLANESSFSVYSRVSNSNDPFIPYVDNPIRTVAGRTLYNHSIQNLISGTSYDFQVLATNSYGDSWGRVQLSTPTNSKPLMPSTINVTKNGDQGIHVSWIGDTSSNSYLLGHHLTYNWVLNDSGTGNLIRFGNTQSTTLSLLSVLEDQTIYSVTLQTQDNNSGMLSDITPPYTFVSTDL